MSEKIKIEELIQEIIHIACQAEISADDQVKRQALGDIYDAIASVLPVDHARLARLSTGKAAAKRSLEWCASPTVAERATPIQPDTPRCDGRACRSATAADGITDCGNGKKYIRLSLPNGFAFAAFVAGHKIAAMGRTMPGGSEAEIYNDGVCELTMRTPRGKTYLYRVVRETMSGVCSRAGRCSRHRKNVAAREDAGREGTPGTGEEG